MFYFLFTFKIAPVTQVYIKSRVLYLTEGSKYLWCIIFKSFFLREIIYADQG